jgi:hypothetical protein
MEWRYSSVPMRILIAVLAVVASQRAVAQAVSLPVRPLPEPELVSPPRITAPSPNTRVRELPDGRLLVGTDPGRVILLDSNLVNPRLLFDTLPHPNAALIPAPDGHTFVARGDERLLVLGPTVTPLLGQISLAMLPGGVTPALFERPGVGVAATGFLVVPVRRDPDSTVLYQVDISAGQLARVATIRSGSLTTMVAGVATLSTVNVDDIWSVLSDGAVMIVRTASCRVDRITPSARQSFPAVPCEPLVLTLEERAQLVENTRRMAALQDSLTPGSRTTPSNRVPDPLPAYDPSGGAFADTEGRLWVPRSRPPVVTGSTAPRLTPAYDIIDSTGKIVDRVRLPAGRVLIGVGRGAVYLQRTDQAIERVRIR